MLPRKGFPEDWIRWVKQCITTHSFSTLVDGRPVGGWIHPQWGIRQGCPLVPLLFVLAADVLATCTQQLCCRGLLQGFQMSSQQTGIPLLQYADDTLFLIEGSSEAAQNMSTLLDIFSNFLGLRLNRAKSTVVTSGMPEEVAGWVSTILATPRESLPIRYLGLPLSAGRVLVRDWQPMIEKVERRLEGWKSCMGRTPCLEQSGSFCHPHLLLIHLSGPQNHPQQAHCKHATILLAWRPTRGCPGCCPGGLEACLQAPLRWQPWDSRHPPYEFDLPHQMGFSIDASAMRAGDSSPCRQLWLSYELGEQRTPYPRGLGLLEGSSAGVPQRAGLFPSLLGGRLALLLLAGRLDRVRGAAEPVPTSLRLGSGSACLSQPLLD